MLGSPLGLVVVCSVSHQLDQNSTAKYLLLDKMILIHCQHRLNVIFGVTKDDSMAFLATGLGSNGLDLKALHYGLLHTVWTILENVGE